VKVSCSNNHERSTCGSKLRVVRLDREGGEARRPITRRHAVIDAPFLAPSGELYYSIAKTDGPTACGGRCEIHRVSRKGVDKVIDSGPDIRLASFALSEANEDFFWRNGREPRVYPPPRD